MCIRDSLWGVGLGLRVQGKPGATKGRVVLAGGLVAERVFEQLGGGGGVHGHRAELLATCGNVLGGQRNGNAIAGRGRLSRTGHARTWSTPAHNLRCTAVPPSGARPGRTPEAAPARSGPVGPPQAGRTPPVGLSGGRATTCGQRPQRPHGAGRTASGLWRRAYQAGRAPRAVGAGGSSSSSSRAIMVATSSM